MKKLDAIVETQRTKDGYVVKIDWGRAYKRIACSHKVIFDQMPMHVKEGNIDILYLPHDISCIALFQDPKGTKNEKYSAFSLYPDPDNSDKENEDSHILLSNTEFPSLKQSYKLGWLPFSYVNGNITVKGRDGIKYSTDNPSVGGETNEEVRKIDEEKLLLKLACGVINESEISKHIVKSAIRATEIHKKEEDSPEVKKLKQGIKERDNILLDVRDKGGSPFVGIPLTKASKDFQDVLHTIREHCRLHAEDTREKKITHMNTDSILIKDKPRRKKKI